MCCRLYSSHFFGLLRNVSNHNCAWKWNACTTYHGFLINVPVREIARQPKYESVDCSQNCRRIHLSCAAYSRESLKKGVRYDPDKFGTLVSESKREIAGDKGDVIEDSYITYPVKRSEQLSIGQYANLIKENVKQNKIAEAVDILEKRMIKEDRVKPDKYIFSLVISACGRFGYTRKAFQLYNQMKKRALDVPGAVYTALFNACANSESSEDGLKRALHLRSQLVEKGVELNSTHCHAMMKAFGHCGDLTNAFEVVDIMVDKQLEINEETFNFLLQACITDKHLGYRHALRVWHKMMKRKIKPTIYTFNLLLRSVRDCAIGTPEEAMSNLHMLTQEVTAVLPNTFGVASSGQIAADNQRLPTVDSSYDHYDTKVLQNFPDLLAPNPTLGSITSPLDLTKPHERLFLLGGSRGFLQYMDKFDVKPTIKTYTLLLDCIPPSLSAENSLMSKMKKDGIKCDIGFFNMLIKKRSFRSDYINAQEVLGLIHKEKLQPDIVTFGVLAVSCTNGEDIRQLVQDMRMAGYRMNKEILGAMLRTACKRHDFKYVMKVLFLMKDEGIQPSEHTNKTINSLIESCRNILKQEQSEQIPLSLQKRPFRKEFTTFMFRYKLWQQEMEKQKD